MGEKPFTPSIEKTPPHSSAEGLEKTPPRLLKGSFYLTKIAHVLMPHSVPDIEEAVEGQQGFKREGVIYDVPENDGDDVENSKETAETGREVAAISDELERLGLTSRIDAHYQSYTGKGKGNVRYIKTLVPWEAIGSVPGTLELLFDPRSLRSSIRRKKTLSSEAKKACEEHLDRILVLFEEEKVEQEKTHKENLRNCAEEIKEIEHILSVYEGSGVLDTLFAIVTEEQAVHSELRNKAIDDRNLLDMKLRALKAETNVRQEQYDALHARYKTLKRAIGARNGGVVDHTR